MRPTPAPRLAATSRRIPWAKRAAGEGTFFNRFDIAPAGGGSKVTYTSRQLGFRNPPWGLRYALMRSVTARVWISIWYRRGFRKMLAMAEQRTRQRASV